MTLEDIEKADRCNATQRIETWPYVKKCKNLGFHEIPDDIAEELDIDTENGHKAKICDYHMEVLLNAGWTP